MYSIVLLTALATSTAAPTATGGCGCVGYASPGIYAGYRCYGQYATHGQYAGYAGYGAYASPGQFAGWGGYARYASPGQFAGYAGYGSCAAQGHFSTYATCTTGGCGQAYAPASGFQRPR